MKKVVFIFIILFSHIFLCQAQTPVWVQKADYSGGEIYDPFCFTIGNKGYVGGGKSLTIPFYRTDFWEYDPVTNIWTQKANFVGTGRYGARGFSIGNYGYAGTGWDPSPKKDFFRYDPVANNWSAVSDFFNARYTTTTFTINGLGYLGLGYSNCKNDFWKFDPSLNSWTQVANFPGSSRQSATGFTIGDTAYVGLGICTGSAFNDFYKYNHLTNSWSPGVSFPGPSRSSAYSFVINNKAYISCGNDYLNLNQPYLVYKDVWEFNPATGTWSQFPDFPGENKFLGASFAINGKGYIGMGSDTNVFNTSYSNEWWEFTPDSITSVNELDEICKKCSLYPNPATEFINIELPGLEKSNIVSEIYTINGQLIQKRELNITSNRVTVSVKNLNSGIYFIKLAENNNPVFIKRFVIIRK